MISIDSQPGTAERITHVFPASQAYNLIEAFSNKFHI